MKKKVIRKVLEESVDKLDGARVRTCGPAGRSEDAIACRRRAEDMLDGAQFGLALACVLFEDDVDADVEDLVRMIAEHISKTLGADHDETVDAMDEPTEGGEQPAPERAIDDEGLAALARDVKRESETKGYMSCAYFGAELNGTATCVACPAKDGGGECRRDVALDILRRLRACGVLPATDADTTVETSDAPEGGDAE